MQVGEPGLAEKVNFCSIEYVGSYWVAMEVLVEDGNCWKYITGYVQLLK